MFRFGTEVGIFSLEHLFSKRPKMLWINLTIKYGEIFLQFQGQRHKKIDHLSQLNAESKVLGNSFPRPTYVYTDIILRLTIETRLLFLSVKEHVRVHFSPPVIIREPVKRFLLKLLSSARTWWLYVY